MSLTRITLLCLVLVTTVSGAGVFVLVRSANALEQELLESDAALARVLGGLTRPGGKSHFDAIKFFVESSDRREASLGLVYAIEIDRTGRMAQGELNPRLFASLGPEYQGMVIQGRRHVLDLLARGKIDRSARIRELGVGRLRFGFDLSRLDRRVQEAYLFGSVAIGVAFLVGVLLSLWIGRRITTPLQRVAGQMTRVVAGDGKPHLEVTVGNKGSLSEVVTAFERVRLQLAEKVDSRSVLTPYLGETIANRILSEDSPLEMTSEERAVTVLVLGFRGLSTLSQERSSIDTLRLTNDYLAPVIEAIVQRKGVVTQLDAPALVAVWGFPTTAKEPERAAVKAALAARTATQQEARRQQAIGGVALEPCIGICSGRAVGGNLGSARRAVYTVMGFAVELAAHAEEQAKPGEILVNEAAFDKLRGVVNGAPCAPLFLEGMEETVPLYRIEG